MFSVLFEVQPRKDEWDVYLARADLLRAGLEQSPGFVDNSHYSSLTRDGWILSLSLWSDEASAADWQARNRGDELGTRRILPDSRLRTGEVTSDTRTPEGRKVVEHNVNDSEGTYVTLIDAKKTLEWVSANNAEELALYLGFDLYAYGDCISWDIFDSLSSPGEIVLLVTWKDAQSANDHAATQMVPDDARIRVVRIVRDEAMPDRDPAPRDHPEQGRETVRP